jgi:hypothetical protein
MGVRRPPLIEYDLRRLFEHPLKFRWHIPSAIVTLGGQPAGQSVVRAHWRLSSSAGEQQDDLLIRWDTAALKDEVGQIEDEIAILRERDEDRAQRTELAAVVVAVALLAHLEPTTRFTRRSATGTSHDYYLNETRDEMIEIAGRWEGSLPSLFEEKRRQSDSNASLRKRWVSVTVFTTSPRTRTEGLHP